MPYADFVVGHYEGDGQGDPTFPLVNAYVEKNETERSRPFRIVAAPGAADKDPGGAITAPARGVFRVGGFAGGKLLIPNGTTISTYDPATATFGALTGSIGGTDVVDAAFTETQGAFLAGGVLYYSDGASVTAVTDVDFPATITSIASLGQRILMSSGDGQFWFTSILDIDDIDALNYYTAEAKPDGLMAVRAAGETAWLFGETTIERWTETGDADDPFRRILGMTIERGCLCRNSIVQMGNTFVFIGDNYSVYVAGDGATAVPISEPWVVRKIRETDPDDIICAKLETEGHFFYQIWSPQFCIRYDVATKNWHRVKSKDSSTYRWPFFAPYGDTHYGARLDVAGFAEISRDHMSDIGQEMVVEFTARAEVERGVSITPVRLECVQGVGLATGQGENPLFMLEVSLDGGNTRGNRHEVSMGRMGAYSGRCEAHVRVRARNHGAVFFGSISDPVDRIVKALRYG